jgi:hypothetical protein
MRLDKLTIKAQDALSEAMDLAAQCQHPEISSLHILQALLDQEQGAVASILQRLGVSKGQLSQSIERGLSQLPKVSGAAGQAGGMYEAFAVSHRDPLAEEGYRGDVMETAGSIENADFLRTGQADVGLIQSGTDLLTDMGGSSALAEVFYEPFWLFARAGAIPLVDGVPMLAGTRVSIGPAGSGTNATARTLLEQSGSTAVPVEMSTDEAVQGLRDGTITVDLRRKGLDHYRRKGVVASRMDHADTVRRVRASKPARITASAATRRRRNTTRSTSSARTTSVKTPPAP